MANELERVDTTEETNLTTRAKSWSLRHLPLGAKLVIAASVDLLDFLMVWFLPGLGSVINLVYEFIATGIAFLLMGWPGVLALWEIFDPSGLLDSLFPTLTVLVLSLWTIQKVVGLFPKQTNFLIELAKNPLLGHFIKPFLPDEMLYIAEHAGDIAKGIEAVPLMDKVEKKIERNVKLSQAIARSITSPEMLDDPKKVKDLRSMLDTKILSINDLLIDMDKLEDLDVVSARANKKIVNRQYKGLEYISALIHQFLLDLDHDLEKAKDNIMNLKAHLAAEDFDPIKLTLESVAEKTKEQIEAEKKRKQIEKK